MVVKFIKLFFIWQSSQNLAANGTAVKEGYVTRRSYPACVPFL